MGVFCCHGNQTKRQTTIILAILNCPYPSNFCTKLESYCFSGFDWLIVLGFNDTTLVGHFVWSPREREKRDSRGDDIEGQGRKRNRNESEETGNINITPLPLPATRIAGLTQLETNISWTPRWCKIPDTFATPNHPFSGFEVVIWKSPFSKLNVAVATKQNGHQS